MIVELAAVAVMLAKIEHHGIDVSKAKREVHCLSEAIYYESRGEPMMDQIRVANVTMNKAKATGRSICQTARNPRIFSWVVDVRQGKQKKRKVELEAWVQAVEVATFTYSGMINDYTDGATHFYQRNTKAPYWASSMTITATGRSLVYLR